MAIAADRKYMSRALALAEKGRGKTSPNPMVGAVIVKNGDVVGEGYHQKAGSDHAEIAALKRAGKRARGATLYVTLEPCCHTGRTGPCTEAIIEAGVSRVVYAAQDPEPRVSGKGARRLRQAGLEVSNRVLQKLAVALNEAYHSYHRLGRPFILVKTAQTIDGKIATTTGESQWITGRDSRVLAHRLRRDVDAVVVGAGTVKADDPQLTVRLVRGQNPYRIVLSAHLSFPMTTRLITENDDYRTIVATSAESARKLTRRRIAKTPIIWTCATDRSGRIDIHDFVERASDFGLRSILVEGGSRVISSFLSAKLVDKVVVITAPMVIGDGINAVGDLGVRKLDQAIRLERCQVDSSGDDFVVSGYPVPSR